MTEPTTALLYLARDFSKRYGVPARVNCSVDSGGFVTMSVEAWRLGQWIDQPDAFREIPEGETGKSHA